MQRLDYIIFKVNLTIFVQFEERKKYVEIFFIESYSPL